MAGPIVQHFDVWPIDDPTGAALGELTQARDKVVQEPLSNTGSGRFTINRNDSQASWCEAGALVRVRLEAGGPFAYNDARYKFAWYIEEGTDQVLADDEEVGEDITVSGRGIMAVFERLVWAPVDYVTGQVDPVSGLPYPAIRGYWRWLNDQYGDIFRRQILEWNARPTSPVPAVLGFDFTGSSDSGGTAWPSFDGEHRITTGTRYLESTLDLASHGIEPYVRPDFTVRCWVEGGRGQDRSATVCFRKGWNIRDASERKIQARKHGTRAFVKDGDGGYTEVTDGSTATAEAAGSVGRRELFVETSDVGATGPITRVGRTALKESRQLAEGPPTMGVTSYPDPRQVSQSDGGTPPAVMDLQPWTDYEVGDIVSLDIPGQYENEAKRLVEITLSDGDNGEAEVALTFDQVPFDPLDSLSDSPFGGPPGAGIQLCEPAEISEEFTGDQPLGAACTMDPANYPATVVVGPRVERVEMSTNAIARAGQSIVVIATHRGGNAAAEGVYDSAGNVYTRVAEHVDPDPPKAHVSIWYALLTDDLPSGATIGFEVDVGSSLVSSLEEGGKCLSAYLFNGQIEGGVESGQGDNFGSAPTVAVGSGDLLVAAIAWFGGASGWPDTFTEDPDWTPFDDTHTNIGPDDSQALYGGFRIADADGETYTGAIDQARDWTTVGAVFTVSPAASTSNDGNPNLVGFSKKAKRCDDTEHYHTDRDPTVDDNWANGAWRDNTLWINDSTGAMFLLLDKDAGTWLQVSGAGLTNPMTTAGDLIIGGASGTPARLAVGTAGQHLVSRGGNPAYEDVVLLIPFLIDGGGSAIATGVKGDIGPFNFAGEIVAVTLLADQSGSIVVDLWKDSYANFPPVVGDSITASAKPTITTATKSQDVTLTGWTKTIAVGDIIRVNVDSATTITRVTLALHVKRT